MKKNNMKILITLVALGIIVAGSATSLASSGDNEEKNTPLYAVNTASANKQDVTVAVEYVHGDLIELGLLNQYLDSSKPSNKTMILTSIVLSIGGSLFTGWCPACMLCGAGPYLPDKF